uniref:Uncharacterized protein n=1 Tax=Haptolina brevifila TaxID=156173 RepID=A0A7S2IKF1_9EUKA
MAELHRGQHPHAIIPFMKDNGPVSWNNKIEISRADWDERYAPQGDGNPLAQVGMGLQERAQTEYGNADAVNARLGTKAIKTAAQPQRPAAPKPAVAPYTPASSKLWGDDSTPMTGTPSSSKMRAPSQQLASPVKTIFFTEQGLVTAEQRDARMHELSAKLGVDKVTLVSSPLQIDTTAQAGHNTAPTAPPPVPVPTGGAAGSSQRSATMRGQTWPATSDYFQREGAKTKASGFVFPEPPPRFGAQRRGAQSLRASA